MLAVLIPYEDVMIDSCALGSVRCHLDPPYGPSRDQAASSDSPTPRSPFEGASLCSRTSAVSARVGRDPRCWVLCERVRILSEKASDSDV